MLEKPIGAEERMRSVLFGQVQQYGAMRALKSGDVLAFLAHVYPAGGRQSWH